MYSVKLTSQFKKDLKKVSEHDIPALAEIIKLLAEPTKQKGQCLDGIWDYHQECYVSGDLRLIYKVDKENSTLTLTRVGTRSDLLKPNHR